MTDAPSLWREVAAGTDQRSAIVGGDDWTAPTVRNRLVRRPGSMGAARLEIGDTTGDIPVARGRPGTRPT